MWDWNSPYRELEKELKNSLAWRFLQEKYEYGLPFAERGFQTVVVDNVKRIAERVLDLDPCLAACLAMYKGMFFCGYGKAGFNAVKEFMANHNIQISDSELFKKFIEYNDKESFMDTEEFMTDDFCKMVESVFSEDALKSDVEEVKLAYICHEMMDKVKPAMKISHQYWSDLEYKCADLLKSECEKHNKVVDVCVDDIVPPTLKIKTQLKEKHKTQFFEFLEYMMEREKHKNDSVTAILDAMLVGYVKKDW